jgi:hypothetical protein
MPRLQDLGSTHSRARRSGLAERWVMAALALLAGLLLAAQHFTGAAAAFAHTPLQMPFDERISGYSLEQVQALFRQLSDGELAAYWRYRLLDLPLPWALAAVAVGLLRRSGTPRLAVLGWLAAGVDTLENMALWCMLLEPEAFSPSQIQLASVVTQAKWVVYGLLLATLAVVAVIHWMQRGRSGRTEGA